MACDPEWVIFTSGATEARNLAVKGLLAGNRALGRHIVASAVEHPATLAACRSAARDGAALDLVGVDEPRAASTRPRSRRRCATTPRSSTWCTASPTSARCRTCPR